MTDSRVQIDQGTANIFVDATSVNTQDGTVERQRVSIGDAVQPENSLVINADGSASVSGYVTASGSVTAIPYGTQGVSGSVSVLNPVSAEIVSGSVTAIPYGTQTVSGSVSVLNGITAEVVSGSVGVTNFPGSFAVNNFPGTQTVAGSVSAVQTGIWSVNQGTPPWTVAGSVSVLNQSSGGTSASVSVFNFPVTQVVSGSVSVLNPSGVQPVSQSGNWTASVQGQIPVTQATSPWLVSQSGSPWGASVQGTVVTTQGTSPWVVSGNVTSSGSVSAIQAGAWSVNQGSPPWSVSQAGNWGASVSNFPAVQVVSGSVSVIESGSFFTIQESTAASVLPVQVSNGQIVAVMSDKFGRQVVIPQAPRDLVGSQSTTITASTAASVVVIGIASTYADITSIILANTSATATTATLSDGTNSYVFYCPAGDMRGAAYQVPLAATATATNWTVACGASVSSLVATVTYIKNK